MLSGQPRLIVVLLSYKAGKIAKKIVKIDGDVELFGFALRAFYFHLDLLVLFWNIIDLTWDMLDSPWASCSHSRWETKCNHLSNFCHLPENIFLFKQDDMFVSNHNDRPERDWFYLGSSRFVLSHDTMTHCSHAADVRKLLSTWCHLRNWQRCEELTED